MGLLETIAENRILAAQDEGLFDNLPGQGKPLDLFDDSGVPEDLRLTFKILKNAGCLPIEMEAQREIHNLQELLRAAVEESSARELQQRLNSLSMKAAISRKR